MTTEQEVEHGTAPSTDPANRDDARGAQPQRPAGRPVRRTEENTFPEYDSWPAA